MGKCQRFVLHLLISHIFLIQKKSPKHKQLFTSRCIVIVLNELFLRRAAFTTTNLHIVSRNGIGKRQNIDNSSHGCIVLACCLLVSGLVVMFKTHKNLANYYGFRSKNNKRNNSDLFGSWSNGSNNFGSVIFVV